MQGSFQTLILSEWHRPAAIVQDISSQFTAASKTLRPTSAGADGRWPNGNSAGAGKGRKRGRGGSWGQLDARESSGNGRRACLAHGSIQTMSGLE